MWLLLGIILGGGGGGGGGEGLTIRMHILLMVEAIATIRREFRLTMHKEVTLLLLHTLAHCKQLRLTSKHLNITIGTIYQIKPFSLSPS